MSHRSRRPQTTSESNCRHRSHNSCRSNCRNKGKPSMRHKTIHRSINAAPIQKRCRSLGRSSTIVRNQLSRSSAPPRVAWLRQSNTRWQDSNRLFERLITGGWDIWFINEDELTIGELFGFDLFLLECHVKADLHLNTMMRQIRTGSLAPLVVLAEGSSLEQRLEGLHAGADAVISFNTPADVVLARCHALLRRWL